MPTQKKRKQQPVKNAAKAPRRTQATVPKQAAPEATAPPEPAKGAQGAHSGHARAEYVRPAPLPDAQAAGAYLDELERCGQYLASAAVTGRNYSWFRRRRLSDPVFAAAEAEALSLAPDVVRSEITRRAIEGTTRMTRYGLQREYDNALLLRYAEYLETGTWKQRQQIETGAPGAFRTRAELQTAMDTREAELARARIEMAAEDARESGSDAEPETGPKVAM